jgi:hypothetical protein
MTFNLMLVELIQADREAAIARQQLAAVATSAKPAPTGETSSFVRHLRLWQTR